MNVILIGYRGSGKTTVGRAAAARLGWRFVDSDAAVVERFGGRSIREIWDTDGEAAFRAAEVDVARELVRGDQQVIALGGGTVMQPAARRAVAQAAAALRFYLKASAAVLARRIAADTTTAAARPSLTGTAGSAEEVAAVLAEREPTYEAVADHVLDVGEASAEEVAARVVAMVEAARGA